jgi:hypothetical protein
MASRSEPRLGYVPHFDVTTIEGRRVRDDDIWQRRNLVLVVVIPPERETASRYASQLEAHRAEFEAEETTVVVTSEPCRSWPRPRFSLPIVGERSPFSSRFPTVSRSAGQVWTNCCHGHTS